MKIFSQSFANEIIDKKYTCDGENMSPELEWRDFPAETKSFALVCHDPDSPSGNFIHWMIVNIPLTINRIDEGQMKIKEATNLTNDFGEKSYGGPCPIKGLHRYIFTVYALNTNKIDDINKDNFYDKIKTYTIDRSAMVLTYQRNLNGQQK